MAETPEPEVSTPAPTEPVSLAAAPAAVSLRGEVRAEIELLIHKVEAELATLKGDPAFAEAAGIKAEVVDWLRRNL